MITNILGLAETADVTIATTFEDARKHHLVDLLPDIEPEDVESLSVEDLQAIVERRQQAHLQATEEIRAAIIAIETGLAEVDDETAEDARAGLERFLVDGDLFDEVERLGLESLKHS